MSSNQERWGKALELFHRAALVDGYSPSTVARVAKDVGQFSRSVDVSPWDVDQATVEAWTEGGNRTDGRRYVLRTSLRTFYRWAYRTGRVSSDPTEATSRLQRPRSTPTEWVPAVGAYHRYLRAGQASPNTIRLRVKQLARIAAELPVRDPWAVETEDLVDWMACHNWARETSRQWRTTLRSFYGWGMLVGHIDRNPALAIPRVSTRPPLPRPASEDAYEAALALCDRRTALMVRLAAEMGLRRAEVATVHSRHLHQAPDGWWLDVRGKGARVRTLPVPGHIASELRQLPQGWTFPGRIDGHLSPERVGIMVGRTLPHGVTMHALRHRFATKAYAVDRDVFTVQQLLGHASPTTTQAYVQVPSSDLRRLVDAVGRGA